MTNTTCVACLRPLTGSYRESTVSGAVWCAGHDGGPECICCGAPASNAFASVNRCGSCRVGAVDSPTQLSGPAGSVLTALKAMGLSHSSPIHVELRTTTKLVEDLGADFVHSLAVTRSAIRADGTTIGKVIITMTAGLPDGMFRYTFAHELGHAVMRDRNVNGLPLPVEEGMAQFIAHAFLTQSAHGLPPTLAAGLARQIERRTDHVYGDGFRAVYRAVSRHGFRPTWVALYRGNLASVGLSSV